MKTNEAVLQTLIEGGITRGFTLPGLGITWSLRAFHERREEFDVVLCRSEQCASVMAQVTGKITGRPGLLMAQGPFASTTGGFGILEGYFSSSPMVVLTDTSCYDGFAQHGVYQTMTGDYGAADAVAVLKTMTKMTTYATTPEEAVYGMQLAIKHAGLPRQGPAAVVMRSNIILKDVPETPRARLYPTAGYLQATPQHPDEGAVARLADLLAKAERPIIMAGNGVYVARSGERLQALAEAHGIAVASSYHGKGVIDETSAVAVGMLGTWASKSANAAMKAADLVLMLGCSMGAEYTRFRDTAMIRPGEQTLVQVDIDPRNAGWVYPVDLAITGDAGEVLDMLARHDLGRARRDGRLRSLAGIKEACGYGELPVMPSAPGTMHYMDIIRALDGFFTPDDLLTLDAGTNRIYATTSLRLRTPHQLVAPGGIGGMGWCTPAAVGAKFACPEKRVTGLVGDGGFAMTMDAVITAVEQSKDVVWIVANNAGLGMVRDNLGNQRIGVDFGQVDFAMVARGMGAHGLTATTGDELEDALREAHRLGGPVVIDAKIDPAASHRDVSDY